MRKLVTITAFAVVALIGAATAGATPPTTTHASIHRSIPKHLPCQGFWIDGEFDLQRTTIPFYDDQGTALKIVSHIHADGTLSNPLTGKSLPDSGDFKVGVDLATGVTTTEGRRTSPPAPTTASSTRWSAVSSEARETSSSKQDRTTTPTEPTTPSAAISRVRGGGRRPHPRFISNGERRRSPTLSP
jgi:hypothetical protein